MKFFFYLIFGDLVVMLLIGSLVLYSVRGIKVLMSIVEEYALVFAT